MKITIYCQHIWGVGHLFRTLEICRALSGHEVILISGGPQVDVALPEHVHEFRLPGLMTDRNYNGLFPTDRRKTFDQVKKERKELLYGFFEKQAADLFVIELYPFGRRAFRFELDPVLKAIRSGQLYPDRVVCSIRDILVEKEDPVVYEDWVIDRLNRYFDALLVHADPQLVQLDDTFSRTHDIAIPIVYTGFITPKPSPHARQMLRQQLNIADDEALIVVSAGGGKAGIVLLEPIVKALQLLDVKNNLHAYIFTGPFMPAEEYEYLKVIANKKLQIHRFTPDFLSYLAAANLSINMGGYNTSMNLLATRVPALVWPYPGDREQGLRAERLTRTCAITVLKDVDLKPARLVDLINRILAQNPSYAVGFDLDGGPNTADWLEQWVEKSASY
jgi:predicted glycosyltransferase